VDAPDDPASTFPGFKRYVIDVSATRIVAMLNLSMLGMAADPHSGTDAVGELEDIRWASVDRALQVARAYAECITGIKIRLATSLVGADPDHSREVLRRARQVADQIGKPIMVHVGGTAISLDEIVDRLTRGDIVTHVYHAHAEGVLDDSGKVRPAIGSAVERGINFDVGHGAGSFNWSVARQALDQGLVPGTISSDIHVWNVAGPVYDLATTASKLLHLGLSLPEVVRRVTSTPAACIGMHGYLGTLAPGAAADLTLLRLTPGEWRFRDSWGQEEMAGTRIEPVAVLHGGEYSACTPAVY
jgi:dihydroorotase